MSLKGPETSPINLQLPASFSQANAEQLSNLNLQPTHVASPEQLKDVVGVLLDERRGKTKQTSAFGTERLTKIANDMEELGVARRFIDGAGVSHFMSIIPPAPYFLEQADPNKPTIFDRAAEVANAHFAVRRAAAEILWDTKVSKDSTWRRNVLGVGQGLAGRKAHGPEILRQSPHLVDGASPYMRVDIVMSKSGIPFVVDITPKSGGYGWWGRKAELLSEKIGVENPFDLSALGESVKFLKQRSGLDADAPVMIIGGEHTSTSQADVNANKGEFSRFPVICDGVTPLADSTDTFFDHIDIEDRDGKVIIKSEKGEQPIEGVGFWWGFEHFAEADTKDSPAKEKMLKILELVKDGKLRLLNHPVGMQGIESKAIPGMIQASQELRDQVVANMERNGLTPQEARIMLDTMIDSTPPSLLARKVSNHESRTIDTQVFTDGDFAANTDPSSAFSHQNPETVDNYYLAKPIDGSGARNILEGSMHLVTSGLNPNAIYEIQPRIHATALEGLLIPHDYLKGNLRALVKPHVPRTELFFTPVDNTRTRTVGMSATFLPGKTDQDDAKIHGGLSAFNIFVTPSNR